MSGDHSIIHKLKTEAVIRQLAIDAISDVLVAVIADRDQKAAALEVATAQLAVLTTPPLAGTA